MQIHLRQYSKVGINLIILSCLNVQMLEIILLIYILEQNLRNTKLHFCMSI